MIAKGLREHGHAIDLAGDGATAVQQAAAVEFDMVILDILLPIKNGLDVCRELRAGGNAVPVLMLTARDAVDDRSCGPRCRYGAAMRSAQLETLRITHRLVLLGLAALTVSGVLLFAADADTFLWSKIFWLKMGLLALLLTNGALMQRRERQVLRDAPGAWPRLRRTAIVSLVLWFVTTLAGAALPNIG
jgi:CheY-like chemotaxis protein